jgi:hypothetical protein
VTGPVTLGDLHKDGKLVWLYCRSCGHERDVDLVALGLPPDLPVPEAGARMVCSRCGGRAITSAPELYPGGVLAQRALFSKSRT